MSFADPVVGVFRSVSGYAWRKDVSESNATVIFSTLFVLPVVGSMSGIVTMNEFLFTSEIVPDSDMSEGFAVGFDAVPACC